MSDDGDSGRPQERSRGDQAFAAFERVEIKLDHLRTVLAAAGFSAVASEDDARGKYGDCKIKFSPKDWRGENYKGRLASDCPAAFLSLYADTVEQMAFRTLAKPAERDNPDRLKFARYDLRDAALARRWAILNKDKPADVAPKRAVPDWEESGPPAARPTPRSGPADESDPWGGNSSADDWDK